MAAFEDSSVSLENFSGKVRLFPLPNLVLFPHVMQPLHIFESRYRELLEDALAGDRLIAMAVLASGWEKNYEGRPPLYSMACLGQLTTHFRLDDGTYNVLLLGLQRVRIVQEIAPSRLFREAKVELCEDQYPMHSPDRQKALRQQLHQVLLKIVPSLPEAEEQLDQLLGDDVPLGVLTDVISYMLDVDLVSKHGLLSETDVYRRAELLLSYLIKTKGAAGGCLTTDFAPRFSDN